MATLTRPPHPGVRLGALLTASIALHWLVLTGWEESAATPTPATRLTVQLLSNPAPEPQPLANAAQSRPLGSPPPTPRATQVHPQPVAMQTSTAADTAPAAPPAPVQQATSAAEPPFEPRPVSWMKEGETRPAPAQPKPPSPADAETLVRATLSRDISRHFKYPRMAQLRSWEGTVLLDLQIETDGRISRITLAQSSGYALLDNNAIATLNRIGSISGTQQWQEGGNIELQKFPIIYRLSDS